MVVSRERLTMTHPTMIDSGPMKMVPKSRAGNDSLHIPFLGAPATAAIPARYSVQMLIDGPYDPVVI